MMAANILPTGPKMRQECENPKSHEHLIPDVVLLLKRQRSLLAQHLVTHPDFARIERLIRL